MSNLIRITNREGNLVVSSRDVAENFNKRHDHVVRDIEELIRDMGTPQNWGHLFIETEYRHEQNKQLYREYLLTRDGFTLLAMGFTGKKALEWKLKYIEAFNKMEQALKEQNNLGNLSPQLQLLINMELKQAELETAISENKQEIQDMRDVIKLDTTSWRKDTAQLISKIALNLGGFEHIRNIREESYKLLDERMGVSLSTRLTNKRRRMADEGVSKSKRDNLNCLDIIAEDKKLIEGYVAIIKEMSIKYKVA